MRPCPVDQRELAQPERAVVDGELRAQRVGARVGGDLDGAAALEADAQPADDRAVAQHERLRARDVALGARRVGRREDLLGRQVREVPQPVARDEVGGRASDGSAASRSRSSVPGPRSSIASNRRSARRVADAFSASMRSSQAAVRVVLVEPQHVLELAARASRAHRPPASSGVDELRPRRVRARDDAPVGRALRDDPRDLRQDGQPVAAGQLGVETVEQPGCGRAGDRDPGAASLGVLQQPLPVPGRNELDRRPGRVGDPGPLHVRVEVGDVDELAPRS